MSMKKIMNQQLALDFCCDVKDVISQKHIFSYYEPKANRRMFQEQETCYLKIACVHGKLLVTGAKDIVDWCSENLKDANAAWFMEYDSMYKLDCILRENGYRIGAAHPFYIATEPSVVSVLDGDITWYYEKEIEQFRKDPRFEEAFAFDELAPDRIGVSLSRDNQILGMAGASSDSPYMWQIGIDVVEQARGEHIGTKLVILLKNELLRKGILPFYGTAMSHIASQNVALHSGFYPAWTELYAEKM